MSTVKNQDCPLCHKPATFEFDDHGNIKHFHCSHCIEFRIARVAEKQLTQERRKQLSEMAQASNDEKVLVITSPPPGENLAVVVEFVLRTKLP